jgi:hypothetical protein
MNKIFKWMTLAWLFFLLVLVSVEAATIIMPVEFIKPGMKGIGRSVFEGNKIEDFEVEILGILRNFQPKKSLILAKLKGRNLEYTGVISGMSGSPVYIDGKLIGAIAYSFAFAKEAVAGITPIGEMLTVSETGGAPKSSPSAPLSIKTSLALDDLLEVNRSLLSWGSVAISQEQTYLPMTLPLVFSGFSSRAFEQARPFFRSLGFYPVRGGSSGQTLETENTSPPELHEGDPVGVELVTGDLSLSAVGTVTYVDGTKVLAFGHPFYNLGAVDYPMSTVKIITVVPSLETSFKMATTETIIGRFSQDRTSGIFGEVGKTSRLIPVNVRIAGSEGKTKDYKIKIVNDRLLSPALTNLSISSIISGEVRALGNLSLEFSGDVYLDNGMSVHLEDLFSGNFDNSITNVSGIMAAVVYYLTNNEFKDVGIHRLDLDVKSSEDARFSSLEKVWLDKYEASPGERIQVKISVRTFKEESVSQEVAIIAPHLPPGTEFQLVIGDAASMHQIEMSQYRTQDFTPRNLSQLIRILSNLRKNNRIYFKILAPKPGIFLKGEELPSLPAAMKSMLASPRAAASGPTELNRSTVAEYQLPLPYVFRGAVVLSIKIRK